MSSQRDSCAKILKVARSAPEGQLKKELQDVYDGAQKGIQDNQETFETYEDEERELDSKGKFWIETGKLAFTFAGKLLSFIPIFQGGINRQGGSTAQYCAIAVVILDLVCGAVLVFVLSFAAVEFVCTFSGAEKCMALANHMRMLSDMQNKANTPSVAGVTTAGALGYHGPFADAVLTAMPYKPVARGFLD